MKKINVYYKKTKNYIKLKVFTIILCSVCLCFLLAPLFNINLINHKKTKFEEQFYVIYTSSQTKEKSEAIEFSQKLRTRGAGGNVFWKDDFWNVSITLSNNLGKMQNIIENLKNQNIEAKSYAHNITLNTKNYPNFENEVYEIFETNIIVINNLLSLIDMLETNTLTKTDAVLEVFNLYTNHQLITIKNNVLENGTTKKYYQQSLSIQSLLFMLSQNTQLEDNVSYQSLIRYYLFKIIELC